MTEMAAQPQASTGAKARGVLVEKTPLESYVPPAKPSLVGLSRAELGGTARPGRRAGEPAQDARAAALALDVCARRALVRRDDQRLEGAAQRAGKAFHRRPAGGRRRAGLRGRHAQMAAAAAERGCGRAAARGRVRLHPGDRSRHAVRLLAGRLHAELLVLPHRHAAAGAQPHRRRDRRPGDDRARSSR